MGLKRLEKFDNIVLALCLSIFLILTLLAQSAIAGSDDANVTEMGGEAVELYHGTARDVYYTIDDLDYFLDALYALGWTQRLRYVNDGAWESDFERSGVGGYDYLYIDTVDFAYFAGHGLPDAFYFGTNHDADGSYPYRVHYSEANWGDLDLEWIVIKACLVLAYQPSGYPVIWYRWGFPVFKGLHAIFGFSTVAQDNSTTGHYFVYYLYLGNRFVDAWHSATVIDQPSDVYAAALAVYDGTTGYIGYNDYLPGYGTVGADIDNPQTFAWSVWQC